MKILFLNNYPSWERVSVGDQASNHLFGIHQQVGGYERTPDGKYRAILKDGLGTVDFMLCKSDKDCISAWLRSFGYDIVYDVMNCTRRTSSLFHYLSPARLVTILHHPPFDKQLKYGNASAYIFFSGRHRSLAAEKAPSRAGRMFVNEWQPDQEWYSTNVDTDRDISYDVVDSGRTDRDHGILVEALRKSGSYGFVFDDRRHGEEGVFDVPGGRLGERDVMELLVRSRCIVIPLAPREYDYGPIGATVFMDAIALRKPVICSDNFYMAEEIRRNNIGLVYHAGDADGLAACLSRIRNETDLYERLVSDMGIYSEDKTMSRYSRRIFEIFDGLS